MRWCKRCGAPLDTGPSVEADASTIVRCPECDAPNEPPSAPAPVSRAVKVLVAAVMAVVGVGFAVMFFARVEPPKEAPAELRSPRPRPPRAAPGASRGTRPAGAPMEVYLEDLCFLDTNGDEAPDPVVWAQDGADRRRAVAVDGATGRGLWASPAMAGRGALACAARGSALVGSEDRSIRALDATTGKARWTASLPGAPDEIVVGTGCITVLTRDGATAGLSLDSGQADPCPSAPRPSPLSGPFWERGRNPQVAQAGDMEVVLSAQTPGTPVLSAAGRRAGASVWKQPLTARAPGARPDMLLAVAGGAAVVAATDVATGEHLRLIGLDVATGKVLYDRPAGWDGAHVAAMKAGAGGRIFIIAGGALRAIDAATGAEAWQASAPPALP